MATLETIKADIQTLSDPHAEHLTSWLTGPERRRRASLDAQAEGQAAVIAALRADGTLPAPETAAEGTTEVDAAPAWVDPAGDPLQGYLRDSVVCHGDRLWRSVVAVTLSEPGTVADEVEWVDITPLP